MALFRCGANAGMSETVLWTNPAPTTNMTSTTITLSQSISNFDFVKLYWRVSTSNNTETYNLYTHLE